MKKIGKIFFGRILWIIIALLFEVGWLVFFAYYLSGRFPLIRFMLPVVTVPIVLWIVNKKINPSYKLAWTLLILAMPAFGLVIYFLFGKSRVAGKMEENFQTVLETVKDDLAENPRVRRNLENLDLQISNQSLYINKYSSFPVYANTQTKYYPNGEMMFEDMIRDLESAKHFIFMEYFIIAKGKMWGTILEILERKVKQGVDVRLIYDDMGCITTLPHHFYKELQRKGIKCAAFNPFMPFVNVILNNRDHRKILVIDGHTGYTGGVNLADEYINEIDRFGYWKDAGLKIYGEGVWSFTVMFLQMWQVITRIPQDIKAYQPKKYRIQSFMSDGFVQPYCDTPLDNETLGENVYMNIINQAKQYVYIFTPYLIIDNEMMTALCLAAKRGVDVRVVTPGTPDKKTVFLLTQSYYEQLLEAGVVILEYQPGFIHSKCFVCDDKVAVVGSINLDYRSLYLHFECGVWMYISSAVLQVKEDAIRTFKDCKAVSLEFCKNRNIVVRGLQSVMRLLAPML